MAKRAVLAVIIVACLLIIFHGFRHVLTVMVLSVCFQRRTDECRKAEKPCSNGRETQAGPGFELQKEGSLLLL
jgi:hypothetical protein